MEGFVKYASIDLETTGLNFENCDIIEFGAVLDDLNNPLELEKLPKFHVYVIQNEYRGEPYALSMHSEIFRRIATKEEGFQYVYPQKLGKAFKDFLLKNGYEEKHDKISLNVAGKNFMGFDYQFLRTKTDMSKHIKMRHRVLDPAILYYKEGDEALPNLATCLERAGLDSDVAHTAVEDSIDVIKLIRKHFLNGF
jgi:DNA polymerase III epsilon subunit-like protein